MPTIEAEFEAKCAQCRAELNVSVTKKMGTTVIVVDPCRDCLEKARDDGEEIGYEKGRADFDDTPREGERTCGTCGGTRIIKVGGCTCGGIDIGVGQMHEPGCGEEQCPDCTPREGEEGTK